jgi:hypothetical protein
MKKLVKLSFDDFLDRIPTSKDSSVDKTRQFNCAYEMTSENETAYLICAEQYESESLLRYNFYVQIVKRWEQSARVPNNQLLEFSCQQLKTAKKIYQVDIGNNLVMVCDDLSVFNKASNSVGSTICCYSLLGLILLKGESDVRC